MTTRSGRFARVLRYSVQRARRRVKRYADAARRRMQPPRAAPSPAEPSFAEPAWTQPVRIGLYVAANLNIIDGSSVWLQSTAHVLHTDPSIGVVIPLRAPDTRPVLTGGLRRLERVALVDTAFVRGPARVLDPALAVDAMSRLDRREPFDIAFLRGYEICSIAARSGSFAGRLWSAFIYEPEKDVNDPSYVDGMREIARASEYVIVQTDAVRRTMESLVPEVAGKTLLVPPAIPSTAGSPLPPRAERLIYTGKFAPHYPFLQMVEIFEELRAAHPGLEFHVAGDKIFRSPEDPGYADRVERALETTPGLVWRGGIAREAVMELLAQGGIALNVWDPAYGEGLNDLVIPSKTLEYCAAGVPCVVQATAAHRDMFGADYPFLVPGPLAVGDAVRRLLDDEDAYRDAASRARAAAEPFTYARVYDGIRHAVTASAGARRRAHAGARKGI